MSVRHRVICVGDSLVMGAWDTRGGWVDRLKQAMSARYVETNGEDRIQVYNLGIGSETTETLLRRLDGELSARVTEAWSISVLVGIGKNDGRIVGGKSLVEIAKYGENIGKIIDTIKPYTERIAFVEPLSVRDEEVEFKNTFYRSEIISEYAGLLKQKTAEMGVGFVGISEDFMKTNRQNMYAFDGIHLNDNGHQFVFERVLPIVEEMIKGDVL